MFTIVHKLLLPLFLLIIGTAASQAQRLSGYVPDESTTEGQGEISLADRVLNFPDKLFSGLETKAERYRQRLQRQTGRYLNKMAATEKKLRRKLARQDSAAARELFGNIDSSYQAMQERLENAGSKASAKKFSMGDAYSGHLDSMQTALKFLQQNKLPGEAPAMQQWLQAGIGSYEQIQHKLNESTRIGEYLKKRQQLLSSQLEKYNLGKQLLPFKKQVYYYRAQLQECRRLFEAPGAWEGRLLEALKGTPAFRDFFNRNAQLAAIFRLPGTMDVGNNTADLMGLQTRSQVQAALVQQFGSSEVVNQALQQKIGQGKNMLDGLKSKVNELGGSSSGMDMPSFKPNTQKTRSFLKRLEYGANVQSQRGNSYLPVSSDLGLSVGYKLNSNSTIGIGGSYKIGLGRDIRHLALTSEGVGLRTYLDIRLKGSIWASGGYEYNYLEAFRSMEALKVADKWQRSGLIGLTKKYRVGKKQGSLQVLYDLLHSRQRSQGQALKIRIGYNLK